MLLAVLGPARYLKTQELDEGVPWELLCQEIKSGTWSSHAILDERAVTLLRAVPPLRALHGGKGGEQMAASYLVKLDF